MTSKSSSSSGHRFHGVKKKAPTPAGRGMSSVATGRYRNRKAAMKGTRFHAILAKVLSRTLKASDVNTAEKKTMEIKALGMRTWAEAHPGWKYYGSEIPIRVGKSASLVDAAYQSWDGKEVYLVDAKYGGKGIFTSGANKSAKRKGEDEHEHEAHRQQVAGYCLRSVNRLIVFYPHCHLPPHLILAGTRRGKGRPRRQRPPPPRTRAKRSARRKSPRSTRRPCTTHQCRRGRPPSGGFSTMSTPGDPRR